MEKLIDIESYPVKATLKTLLQDKTTKQNIIWATNTYSELGAGFQDKDHINVEQISGLNEGILEPRVSKSLDAQRERTRGKAEVMTPSWLVNEMNNFADAEWFGYQDVFNTEIGQDAEEKNPDSKENASEENKNTGAVQHRWKVKEGPIVFPEGKTWKQYVDSRRLEITCGEAPFLVSRYDTVTGEIIVPPINRTGILDRKMRIVNENAKDDAEWLKWTFRAFQSCYGYEYQGDNLLIARINMLLSFADYYKERMGIDPDKKLLGKIATIIAWNIWQMDGLKCSVPLGAPYEENHQITVQELLGLPDENKPEEIPCRIYNWRSECSMFYSEAKAKE